MGIRVFKHYHIYPSYNPLNESRVVKMIEAQSELKFIKKIYFISKSKDQSSIKNYKRYTLIKLNSYLNNKNIISKIFGTLIWYLKIIIFFLKEEKNQISISFHSFSVLPLTIFFKIFTSAKLIYEPHEYESGMDDKVNILNYIVILTERFFFKYINLFIAPTYSIERIYKKNFDIKCKTTSILNVSRIKQVSILKKKNLKKKVKKTFKNSKKRLNFVYVGLFEKSRKMELLLSVFQEINHNIIFFGYGTYENKIKNLSKIHSNIKFGGKLKEKDVVDKLSSFDLGFVLLDNCINYKYALPNKFFQYINGRLPIITNNNKDMKIIINKFNCGWIFKKDTDLKKLIDKLNHQELKIKLKNLDKVYNEFSWMKEKKKIKNIYIDYLNANL